MGRGRRVVAVVIAVVVLLGVVVVAHRIWVEKHRTDLSRALNVVPSATKRLAFTDWRSVRSAVGAHLGMDPDPGAVATMVGKAYDADLSSASSIGDAAAALQRYFGFSPGNADWEAYGQSDQGAVMVLRMPDGFDFGVVTDHLDRLGFTKPGSRTGVWKGGVDLVAAIDPTITPELQYVAVLADQHLIVTSDQSSYAASTVKVVQGKAKSLGDLKSARQVVAPLHEPAAAMMWTRDFACNDLAMSSAGQDDQDQAAALLEKAGKVTPLDGLVMSMAGDRSLSISELFENSSEAKENLRARARLIVGDAPGRGGAFSDDMTLRSSRTDGPTVQLRLTPTARTGYLLSAYDSGPVLFATC
ncbi:MAG: hypothetical protein ACJ72E_13875 [Marmoricola sp.]